MPRSGRIPPDVNYVFAGVHFHLPHHLNKLLDQEANSSSVHRPPRLAHCKHITENLPYQVLQDFLFINNCMCFGATKPPPTQQNVNQSRISPYESQASIGGNDGLHYPWAVGNWIHSGTADGSDIHLRLSSYTRFVVHPTIYKLLYIPSGAGFLPSTECLNICTMRNWNTPKGPKLQQKLLQMLRIQNSLLKMLL